MVFLVAVSGHRRWSVRKSNGSKCNLAISHMARDLSVSDTKSTKSFRGALITLDGVPCSCCPFFCMQKFKLHCTKEFFSNLPRLCGLRNVAAIHHCAVSSWLTRQGSSDMIQTNRR